MKLRHLLLTSLLSFVSLGLQAQVIYDYQTEATSGTFQYFGSTIDGQLSTVIDNPNPSGINTSTKVKEFKKPAGAQTWAGGFTNPDPVLPIDFSNSTEICVKVHMDHIGNVTIKFEGGIDGAPEWIFTQPNTKINEWEEICFDVTIPSIEAPFEAAGTQYSRMVVFMDFGMTTAEDQVFYLDDFTVSEPAGQPDLVLRDFETDSTTGMFQFFGSSLEGQLSMVIANPNPSGINTSDSVSTFPKPTGAQVWAGGFTDFDSTAVIDLTDYNQLCVKVHKEFIGNVTIKLEIGMDGAPDWILTQPNTKVNEWEEICFDVTLPSIEAPFEPAGTRYSRMVVFMDFGETPMEDRNNFIDDILLRNVEEEQSNEVTFSVDMNNYAGDFDTVFVQGTFNDFSKANPMTSNGDGTWSTTLDLATGAYEYLFYLGGADEIESFNGTDVCTRTTFTPTEKFVNRSVVITQNTALDTVGFNSCYAIGAAAKITFQLGLGDVEADSTGVYLAGGADFGVPGGAFQLLDEDGDGVYELTIERALGFGGFYTFANGACADFSCKEDIAGQDCANPNNFNDRFLEPLMQDITIATCYGVCSDNTACTVTSTRNAQVNHNLMSIQPNVASTQLNVFFTENLEQSAQLYIMSSVGSIIKNVELNQNLQQEINITQLPAGIYLLHLRNGNSIATQRFIKN